jgi:tetratricopeptide (TPR) repeat protein
MHNSADRFGKRNLVVVSTFFILILFFIFSSNVHAVQQGETNPGIVFEASLQQGMQAYNTGNFEQAILQWRAAIQQLQAEADEQGLANTHLYLAGALQELGRFGEAIDSLNQALDQAQKLGDQDMQTRIMASLGQVYILTGNEEEAVRYITGSADRTKKDADPALRAAVLNNLGNLFESQKKYDQSTVMWQPLPNRPTIKNWQPRQR